ncbi:MAG: DJ-1/PfpI family protein [Bacteroidaceae bacterium]|nr:DJ-1/PfpI family protein [Alistipes sp.]MBR5842019.1 DJ-1/PfpI family protein [Bacteroidaceae bacterium]
MKTMYVFLAEGFEEIEALAPVDVMRRAGLRVIMVSTAADLVVNGAHGIPVVADAMFDECDYADAELLFLPGGLPGATNLEAHEALGKLLVEKCAEGVLVSAICAAPLVLGGLGLLEGKQATCYPGFEGTMAGATYTAAKVTCDGNIFTACGPGAAWDLGFAFVEHFCGAEKAAELRQGMQFN